MDPNLIDIDREIEQYKKKIAQARERKRIEAAKAKREEARRRKKEDDRRKVLFGVGVLEAIRHGRISEEKVFDLINQSITRPQDRQFLGLPEAPQVRAPEGNHDHKHQGAAQ